MGDYSWLYLFIGDYGWLWVIVSDYDDYEWLRWLSMIIDNYNAIIADVYSDNEKWNAPC